MTHRGNGEFFTNHTRNRLLLWKAVQVNWSFWEIDIGHSFIRLLPPKDVKVNYFIKIKLVNKMWNLNHLIENSI